MTMPTKIRMPSLVNTMLTYRQKELNVIERNACNVFSSHVEAIISSNGNKGVVNYIMGSNVLVVMNTM